MPKHRAERFVDPSEDPRDTETSLVSADERTTLADYLRYHRQTLRLKCGGLTPEQLARRSVEPSTLSLLGLVRHMADVELSWFRRVLAGEQVERRFRTPENADADFDDARGDPEVVAEAWRAWDEEVAFAEAFVDRHPDLGAVAVMSDGGEVSYREVLVHMVEEYARHNGHADLLRERIDGRIGQ
ncbi:MAG TPA: DinB family protein [Acidimicrobiales bacterium]|nr:DinB family protein [Acidimicrobiales bacterium]